MTNVSRRSIAKGAAWSVPAVAVASAAPALGASVTSGPSTITACPQGTAFSNTGAGSISAMVAGDGTYGSGKTYVSISTGQIQIPAATGNDGSSVTGFYIFYTGGVTGGTTGCDCSQALAGSVGPEFTITTKDGAAHRGKVTYSGTSGCSPQVADAGFTGNLGIQTDITYPTSGDTVCFVPDYAHIVSMDIPFTVVYLNGLTPIGCCHYTRHVTYNPTGCMPFGEQSHYTTYISGGGL